jgi:hypothetical protein
MKARDVPISPIGSHGRYNHFKPTTSYSTTGVIDNKRKK